MRALMVTGSRALALTPAATQWARRAILCELSADPHPEAVVHGRAEGPDLWADEAAAFLLLPRVAFSLVSGGEAHVHTADRVRRLKNGDRYRYDIRDPLARNAAMVRWCADRAAEGHSVRVLALVAPWSATQGTDHTVRLARDHDLEVMRLVAPDDMAPGDA